MSRRRDTLGARREAPRQMGMGEGFINRELAAFVESGNSMVVATRNAALVPSATRACAVRVLAPDRVAVLLPRATSARSLADLRENASIAVCVSSPRDFRTVQLKGVCLAIEAATAEDCLAVEEQLRGFGEAALRFGMSRQQVRNMWLFDNQRVVVQVTAAYAQTPGPGAGRPLGRSRGG